MEYLAEVMSLERGAVRQRRNKNEAQREDMIEGLTIMSYPLFYWRDGALKAHK